MYLYLDFIRTKFEVTEVINFEHMTSEFEK